MNFSWRSSACSVVSVAVSAFALLLSGCGVNAADVAGPVSATGVSIRGRVHGGEQPVVGAHVYLFAAATSGPGSASISLLSAGAALASDGLGAYALTGSDGSFSISGDYTCTPGQQVYLYALGGDTGSGGNTAASMMSAMGVCPAAGNLAATVPYVWINEVSTVAAAYALAGFAADSTHVASSASVLGGIGLGNAFLTAGNLTSTASGTANTVTPAGNGTVPAALINTLADILEPCVNSDGPSSDACVGLFSNALSQGTSGIQPTDTATAAINIAHNPAANVAALFGLQPGVGTAFQPNLPQPPNDFTMQVMYTGGGLASGDEEQAYWGDVNNVAVDGLGNVWHANFDSNSVTELSAVGAPLSPAGGFTDASLNQPSNVAIDVSGNAWTANNGASTVTVFTGGGALLAGAPFTVGNGPSNLAVDASGTVWVINSMDLDVSRLTGSGANVLGSPYTSNVLSQPIGIAALSAGYVAVTNAAADTLSLYDNTGAMPAGPFGGNGLSAPYGLAIDAGGDAWIADNSQVTEFTGLGGLAAGSPFSPPASPIPTAVAIDGAGNAWITEVANDSLIEMSNAGAVLSGATGIEPNPAVVPEAVAVDGSGNVWYSSTNQGALYELVGAAVPVVTPLAYGVQNNLLGQQP